MGNLNGKIKIFLDLRDEIKKFLHFLNTGTLNGDSCARAQNNQQHVELKDLKLPEIAFGHIISQKWANTYPFLSETVNHPDNLYLTCRSCNSSLSDLFPGKQLRDQIVLTGTIGDWIRNHEREIQKE